MSETAMGAPGGSAASAPDSSAASSDVQTQVGAATDGNAPVGSEGAAVDGQAQDSSSVTPAAAEFLFNGRKWRSQQHAEQAIAAQIGRTPQVQRENAMLQQQIAEMQQQMQALRALSGGLQGVQGEQGRGQKQDQTPQSLADELAKSGELAFIKKLAEDPEVGQEGALYALTQAIEKRMEARQQSLIEQHIQPLLMQRQADQALTRAFGATRQLAQHFPELDESNESPEAEQARAEILELIGQFPPDMLAQKPEFVISSACLLYREMNGIPTFAVPPGSSGSPSAIAAQAAEAANQPLDIEGSGTPHPRVGGEAPIDRVRRENRALNSRVARTPSGRPLGFEVS